ncbi:hypothetical protein CMI37_26395 [Candidatus Pacearchaeota archaeon]|nr:hypothetical protein [Candidatus Pacearchaeota archaeon]|tara:strand:+ start:6272 stop:6712 length:441 start_codon:yes stop_codon:yes gene_type:complete
MAKDIRLIGFNFTKISAQRNPDYNGKVEAKSNVDITNMEKVKTPATKNESLKVDFSVDIDYGELGKVELTGNLFLMADQKLIKETVTGWEEKKQPNNIQLGVVNIILQKTTIKAIQIEEEIGLPIHLQNLFPQVKPSNPEQKTEDK